MADKSIGELVSATSVGATDLFVLEQNNTAKKLTGQILENWLVSFADGHGGIHSLVKTSSSGTNPVIDTYTITYADQTTSTFQVKNGVKGDKGDNQYVHIKYSSAMPTKDSDMYDTPDNYIGIYSGVSSTAPTAYTSYTWFKYKGEKGDIGTPATIISQAVEYQAGTSGTVIPSGTWTTTLPTVPKGSYLWTKTTISFNSGSPVIFYSVARMGVDGSGAVSTVNNIHPDGNGNITIDAEGVGAEPTISTLPISKGGTGSTTAQAARTALEITPANIGALSDTDGSVTTAKLADHAVSVDYTVTLDTTWSGSVAPYTKEQTINGILAADKPLIDLVPSATFADAEKQVDAWANVYRAVAAANKITFYANTKPTESIPLQIRCIRK